MSCRRRGRSRLLIVDDVPKNIQVLGNILQQDDDYHITAAMSGRQALNALDSFEADLILLDIVMPEMDGFETCKRIKSDPAARDIPVIFLTARYEIENLVKGFKLGAVDYITKPVKPEELVMRALVDKFILACEDRHFRVKAVYHIIRGMR